MIPMYEKFNDDICFRFLVIMKDVLISFIKEYRASADLEATHIRGQIEAVFNILKFSKWPPFWGHKKLFYRK